MRKLTAAAQEEPRRQAVVLRQRGLTYQAIAAQVGLSRTGVFDICRRFAAEGAKGLVGKPRGPPTMPYRARGAARPSSRPAWAGNAAMELWPKLGDGGVRKAAYRGG